MSATKSKKSKPNSRHADPSMEVLAPRMDRKLNALADLVIGTMKPLADEFTRVLRQNDTLRGQNETLQEMLKARDLKRLPHVYMTGNPRCSACGFLRGALEAIGIDCGAAMKLSEILERRERAKEAADAFIAEPLTISQHEVPTLPVTDIVYPSTHDYGENEPRCKNCHYLRQAIEASGLDCVPLVGNS